MEKTVAIALILFLLCGASLLFFQMKKSDLTGKAIEQAESEPLQAAPAPQEEKYIPQTHILDIKNQKISPSEITIKRGDTIIWVNNDIVNHHLYSGWYNIDKFTGIDSGYLNKGESYSMIFNDAGTFLYRCKFFPYVRGKIIVQ